MDISTIKGSGSMQDFEILWYVQKTRGRTENLTEKLCNIQETYLERSFTLSGTLGEAAVGVL